MMFTIEFMRVRASDNAHATLDRLSNVAADLDAAKVSAKALFATWDLPQTPDALRILDEDGRELFFWNPGMESAWQARSRMALASCRGKAQDAGITGISHL
jgi:hypothetical protein